MTGEEMVGIRAGRFRMGSEGFYPEKRAVRHRGRRVRDRCRSCTVGQPRRFVDDTARVMLAERAPVVGPILPSSPGTTRSVRDSSRPISWRAWTKAIRLSCTTKQFEQLDAAENIELLSSADLIATQQAIGIALPTGHHSKPTLSDVVPTGEVAVRRGDAVHAKDGWIGGVDGLVIDPASDHVTHVILQEGHLSGSKHVAIPIGAANRVEHEIRVDLTKKEVEALSPVSHRSGR